MTEAAADSPIPVRSIALLSGAAFCSAATLRIADPLLPQVAEEFAAGVSDAAIIATGFTLAYGLCQLVHGPIGDQFGKYGVITLMTFLSALTTATAALSPSLFVLGTLRFVSGATAAALIPLSMAYIGDVVPYDRRQPVLARFMSGQILGVIGGQVAGGLFGEFLGWRGVFVALAAVYLAFALLLALELRSPRVVQTRTPFSVGGLVSTFLALGRSARVRLVLATVFVEGMLFFGGFTYLGAFLRHEYGLGYAAIGGVLSAFGGGALVYALAAPRIVAALGQRNMVAAGGAALAAGFAVFALQPPWPALVPGVALCGLGFYLFHNTLQTQATQMAPHARGIAVSVFASCLFLGQAAGIALAGPLAEALGYAAVFVGAGVLLLLLALVFRRRLTP